MADDSDWECPLAYPEIGFAASTSGYDTDDSWHVLQDSDDESSLHVNVSEERKLKSQQEDAAAATLVNSNKHDSNPEKPRQTPPKSKAADTLTTPLRQRAPDINNNNISITAAARALLFQATRCSHWAARLCHLTSTAGKCCECADARGRSSGAERYMHYCPGCKTSCEAARDGSAARTAVVAELGRLDSQQARQRQHQQQHQRQHQHQNQHQRQQRLYTPTDRRECLHWLAYGCALAGRRCCACADKRADDGEGAEGGYYLKYVDGLGDVLGATRWEYYCPGCVEASRKWPVVKMAAFDMSTSCSRRRRRRQRR
ncbi:DUF2368 domain-containing protein [Microdochium nivale]|nr:DUF2368 domain-containing protein [Microdochium nivale]